jgi:hypothetical protein
MDTRIRDAIKLVEDDNTFCEVLSITTVHQDTIMREARGRLAKHRKNLCGVRSLELDRESLGLVTEAARIMAEAREYIRPVGRDTKGE